MIKTSQAEAFVIPDSTNKRWAWTTVACVFLTLMLGSAVAAQTFRGSILGTVTDPNGAVRTPLTEGVRLELRAEIFNIFNHPNFSSPLLPGFQQTPASTVSIPQLAAVRVSCPSQSRLM